MRAILIVMVSFLMGAAAVRAETTITERYLEYFYNGCLGEDESLVWRGDRELAQGEILTFTPTQPHCGIVGPRAILTTMTWRGVRTSADLTVTRYDGEVLIGRQIENRRHRYATQICWHEPFFGHDDPPPRSYTVAYRNTGDRPLEVSIYGSDHMRFTGLCTP